MVMIAPDRVSTARVEITVAGAGLTGVAVTVRLARPLILDRLELSLAGSQLLQAEAGGSGADHGNGAGLRSVRWIFHARPVCGSGWWMPPDEAEVLVTTQAHWYSMLRAQAQSVLTSDTATGSGSNQGLRVEMIERDRCRGGHQYGDPQSDSGGTFGLH